MIVVYLNDTKIPYEESEKHFRDAADWAKQQCPTFVDHNVQDVSDVSITNDFIAQYRFKDSKDALLFQLKWRSN